MTKIKSIGYSLHLFSAACCAGVINGGRKAVGLICAALLVINQCTMGAWAQGLPDGIDFDPPVIDHESISVGVPGEPQLFSALVIDDMGVEHVLLYHRRSANDNYTSVSMDRIEDTANYMVSIETPEDQHHIEYYIEALDTGGNRVLKGFPFYPLVRELKMPVSTPTVVAPAPSTESAGKTNNLLYIVLGVLAVGALAALAGGSDGSGGESPVTDGVATDDKRHAPIIQPIPD